MSINETTLSVQDLSGASISFPLENLTWGQLRTLAALGRLFPDDVPVWVAAESQRDRIVTRQSDSLEPILAGRLNGESDREQEPRL